MTRRKPAYVFLAVAGLLACTSGFMPGHPMNREWSANCGLGLIWMSALALPAFPLAFSWTRHMTPSFLGCTGGHGRQKVLRKACSLGSRERGIQYLKKQSHQRLAFKHTILFSSVVVFFCLWTLGTMWSSSINVKSSGSLSKCLNKLPIICIHKLKCHVAKWVSDNSRNNR